MTKNIRRIEITGELLPRLLTEGVQWRVERGLPMSCVFEGLYYDPARNVYTITVESPHFDPVKEGELVPLLEPIQFRALGELEKL